MRFLISLEAPNIQDAQIPVNYQYEMSAWIYKLVNAGNNVFAEWLHSHGYSSRGKSFKMFVFSMLNIPKLKIEDNYIQLLSTKISFKISFLLDEIAEPFIYGMFKQREFDLGDRKHKTTFFIKSIERLPCPVFNEKMKFTALSPVVVSSFEDNKHKQATYLPPDNPKFNNLFLQNLVNKYVAVLHYTKQKADLCVDKNLDFIFDGKYKQKLIKIKADTPQQTFLKGYMFDFELIAPEQIMKIAYHAGCGEKNSLGFGCIEIR